MSRLPRFTSYYLLVVACSRPCSKWRRHHSPVKRSHGRRVFIIGLPPDAGHQRAVSLSPLRRCMCMCTICICMIHWRCRHNRYVSYRYRREQIPIWIWIWIYSTGRSPAHRHTLQYRILTCKSKTHTAAAQLVQQRLVRRVEIFFFLNRSCSCTRSCNGQTRKPRHQRRTRGVRSVRSAAAPL